ncbi:T9SS type A sorting domain-containing protein [Mariniflexile sp. HNIBRBA6329]|uniref:T9SS type A sorting domain-containing protein n=1 Tax=Mariniflexile sp. HNIBRBA6329 TaxID=3373088 RepID=UPI003746F38C
MKEKVHVDTLKLIFKNIKTYFFLLTFLFFAFSTITAQNSNANENATVYGGEITFIDGEKYTSVCVGDGEPDYVDVILENASGRVKQWIITNEEGDILGLPDSPSDVDFDGAGVGVCYIYHLAYNGIKPLVDPSGQGKFTKNIDDIVGRFDLSEPIMVERFQQPTAGTLEGGPFEFCVNDDQADNIPDGSITLSGNMGTNYAWVVTDSAGKILGTPDSPYDVNFDEAPEGVCLIWHLSYENNVSLNVENANDLTGCYALSNPINVNRIQQPEAGNITLADGSTDIEICAGDGISDLFEVTLTGASGGQGVNMLWVITDADANILDTSTNNSFDLEGAGDGVCLIWHLSYAENVSLEGITNAGDLMGCYDLSNPITVNRIQHPEGGNIALADGSTDIEICAGDGNSDLFEVTLTGASGGQGVNMLWVITDADANILDTSTNNSFDLEGAGEGVCLIWHLSYAENVSLEGVTNAGDLMGCYDLSNAITVTRNGVNGGVLTGGTNNNFDFTIDETEDKIPANAITLEGNIGTNSAWVVTNEEGTVILGLPANYSDVDFNTAGVGVCKIWHLSYEEGLTGIEPPGEGDHLVSSLDGCFSLSNAITVTRTAPSTSKVALFPNPAKSSVNIDYSKLSSDRINVSINNLRNVQLSNKDYSSSNKRTILDLSNYDSGLYFIRVTDKATGESFVKRLVIYY